MALVDAFDLSLLFRHRDLLATVPGEPPSLRLAGIVAQPRRVAILSGSFNPPTIAHALIAERALLQGFDLAVLALPAQVAGKDPSGLMAEDRLLALRLAAGRPGTVAATVTHGLYVDQAEAATRAFPDAEIAFLAGSDKVVQIFEAEWYDDRDAALERLFSRVTFLVAPRAADGPRLRAVLHAPENRRFADAVTVVPLHPSVSDLSSTRVRGLLEAGADASGLVVPAVADMLAELQPFARAPRIGGDVIDPYRIRARLVDALWQVREWAERAADLRGLTAVAASPTPEGRRLRAALADGPSVADEILRLQAIGGA